MRSYSSLLCHVLGSHREISGYAELHDYYSRKIHLLKLRYAVYRINNNRLDGRYVLDKVLHNYLISENILNRDDVKIIFLLRNPEDTIKSIIKMKKINSGKDISNVADYYIKRLNYIEEYVKMIDRETLFIQSEKIIEDTSMVLNKLKNWLELKTKLKPKYSIFKYTGKPVYGDPSNVILTGEIKNQISHHSDIVLHPTIIRKVRDAYENCSRTLLEYSNPMKS